MEQRTTQQSAETFPKKLQRRTDLVSSNHKIIFRGFFLGFLGFFFFFALQMDQIDQTKTISRGNFKARIDDEPDSK